MVSKWVRQTGHGTKAAGALRVTINTTNTGYKMHHPELAKRHPSILRGNKKLICVSVGGVILKFEGMVYCACQEYMIMILAKLLDHTHDANLLVDVRFTLYQTTMHTSPLALVDNGVIKLGSRIKSGGASQPTMNTTKYNGQHDSTMRLLHRNFVHVVRDHPVACAFLYRRLLN
jgi:hypothetical protein